MKKSVKYYTIEEVAEALRLHPYTVRRLCREGKIPGFKFGGQWRFKREDIDLLSKKTAKLGKSSGRKG